MIDLQDWISYVKSHRLKFKFRGLSGFHASVGEAASSDKGYMERFLYNEQHACEAAFDAAVLAKEDDCNCLSNFCNYVSCRVPHREWHKRKLPSYEDWALAPIDDMLAIVKAFRHNYKSEFIADQCAEDAEYYIETICSEGNQESLLKEHPPVEVFNYSGGYGIPVADVFFVCPACHGEPNTEADLRDCYGLKNGLPVFYCGSCGSEMNVGDQENILDFFNSLGVTPYPFNEDKRKHWQQLMAERKSWGDNKLQLKAGDRVYLKKETQYMDREVGACIVERLDEPGDLVRVTAVDFPSISYETEDGESGCIAYQCIFNKLS